MSGRNTRSRSKSQEKKQSAGQAGTGQQNGTNKGQRNSGGSKPSLSTVERVRKEVPPIATRKLQDSDVYIGKKINPTAVKEHFLQEGRLKEDTALRILREAKDILKNEGTVLDLEAPLTICGDIHGQFYDLVHLFDVGGQLPDTKYLFLGDYVDRGMFSIEVVLYLFSLKILYSKQLHLLRGNHECRHLTAFFTFKEECRVKYSQNLYIEVMKTFDCLPLACLMNKKFLCIHGGLSPNIHTVDEIRRIDRFREPPKSGPMCDILWSDPRTDFGEEENDEFFCHNGARGCSFYFSYAAACSFIEANGLLSIIRAHEAQDLGYKMYKKVPSTNFPALFTLFSAPNYLDVYNNKGAILKYDSTTINVKTYKFTPHPYWLPNFMDAFTWSLPFVGEKVTDMLYCITTICTEQELAEAEADEETAKKKRKEETLNKFRAIGKMARYYKTLNEDKVAVMKLKGLSSNGKLPMGALSGGNEAINAAIASDNPVTFFEAKNADAENERMPEVKEITAQQRRASVTTRDAYISELANKQQGGSRGSLPPESSPKIKANGEKISEADSKDKKKTDKK